MAVVAQVEILEMEEIKAEMDKVAMKVENPGMVVILKVILKAILMAITLMEIKAMEKLEEIQDKEGIRAEAVILM